METETLKNIIEIVIPILFFSFGYGKLTTQIKSNKELTESKFRFMEKEIEVVQLEKGEHTKATNQIRSDIAELKSDVKHILKTIDQINNK